MENLNVIVNPLLKWYQINKRELPWREGKNPYFIWLSEIMLQQTRIEAVKDYYQRFIKKVPNVHALASIEEEDLLKLWEGLRLLSKSTQLEESC